MKVVEVALDQEGAWFMERRCMQLRKEVGRTRSMTGALANAVSSNPTHPHPMYMDIVTRTLIGLFPRT